jgi:hypothetical protein
MDTWVDTAVDTTPDVPPGDPCTPVGELECGSVVSAANDDPGSTSLLTRNACAPYTWSGPEIAWSIALPASTELSVHMTGLSADIDLFLFGETAGVCDTDSCLNHSIEVGDASEHLEHVMSSTGTVYIMVDGFSGDVSDFTLTVDCLGG